MADTSGIREHMKVIGADGVHVGTVDRVEDGRIKLTRSDSGSGSHQGHHHYLPEGLVAEVEGQTVRLSATGANALLFQQEDDGSESLIGGKSTGGSSGDSTGSGWNRNWTGAAIAAAGIASVAGAALYARRNSDSDSQDLRLETDENVRLISSTKVEGTPVVGPDGETLGKIESFMVDKFSGRVAYAVLSFGGFMGFGESLFPLPWSFLDYDEERDGYGLNLTKEQLAKAPRFKPSETPEFDADYRRHVAQSYRLLIV